MGAAAAGIAQGAGQIIGAGMGMIQSHYDRKWARESQRQQNLDNINMANIAWERDLEMWKRNNLYNSPQEQMARLKAAGLNPNLVYGSGSVVGNTSGQIPKYQRPEMRRVDVPGFTFGNLIPMMQGIAKTTQQINNLKANTEALGTKKVLDNTAAALNIAREADTREKTGYNISIRDYQTDALKQSNKKLGQQITNLALQKELMDIDKDVKKERKTQAEYQTDVEKLKSDLAKDGMFQGDDLLYRKLSTGELEMEDIILIISRLFPGGSILKGLFRP